MTARTQVGRLALRVEGEWWNAYYALPDTMTDAMLLGSVRLGAAQDDPEVKALFMQTMQQVVSGIVKDITGMAATWGAQPEASNLEWARSLRFPKPVAGTRATTFMQLSDDEADVVAVALAAARQAGAQAGWDAAIDALRKQAAGLADTAGRGEHAHHILSAAAWLASNRPVEMTTHVTGRPK